MFVGRSASGVNILREFFSSLAEQYFVRSDFFWGGGGGTGRVIHFPVSETQFLIFLKSAFHQETSPRWCTCTVLRTFALSKSVGWGHKPTPLSTFECKRARCPLLLRPWSSVYKLKLCAIYFKICINLVDSFKLVRLFSTHETGRMKNLYCRGGGGALVTNSLRHEAPKRGRITPHAAGGAGFSPGKLGDFASKWSILSAFEVIKTIFIYHWKFMITKEE